MAESIVRRDRYTVIVDGHPIRATEDQERRLRAMDAEARSRFLVVMGATSPAPLSPPAATSETRGGGQHG